MLFPKNPIVHVLPQVDTLPIKQLKFKGKAPIATELETQGLPLAGRLQYFIKNWEMLTQDQWVLDAVQGYKVPFTQTPYQPHPPRALHHPSEEEEIMQEVIKGMLEKQAIEETTPRGRSFLSMIFLMPKKDTDQRPVINLKSLNRFVHTEHFKMEGIHVLRDLLRAGGWMGKIDLKDAHFTLPIQEEDRAFLKCSFKDHTYQFKCLPSGLACAPWVFTKTLTPIAAQLRQLGMRLIVYIDNILILAELAQDHVIRLVYMLENLGFAVSKAKCQLEPTQTIQFLRFSVHSLKQELSLPSAKVKKIRVDTRSLLEGREGVDQEAVRVSGQASSCHQGSAPGASVLPQTSVGIEAGPRAVRSRLLNAVKALTEEQQELQWWLDHLTGKAVNNDRLQCLNTRLGSDVRGCLHGQPVVSGGRPVAHKLPRRTSHLPHSKMLETRKVLQCWTTPQPYHT